MKIKVMSHDVKTEFISGFEDRNDLEGRDDNQRKLIRVACKSTEGYDKPLSGILVILFHELGHEIDWCTGHNTFSDGDPEQQDIKEGALDAFSEGLVQMLLDNKMLSEKWLAKLQKEIDRARK